MPVLEAYTVSHGTREECNLGWSLFVQLNLHVFEDNGQQGLLMWEAILNDVHEWEARELEVFLDTCCLALEDGQVHHVDIQGCRTFIKSCEDRKEVDSSLPDDVHTYTYVMSGSSSESGSAGSKETSLRKGFSAATFTRLEAKKVEIIAEEQSLYAEYLFGSSEPSTAKKGKTLLNKFLRKHAGQEPSTDAEKQFLVRALQFYGRKWKLTLMFNSDNGQQPCRISTAMNRSEQFPRRFQVSSRGRDSEILAATNALPDLVFE